MWARGTTCDSVDGRCAVGLAASARVFFDRDMITKLSALSCVGGTPIVIVWLWVIPLGIAGSVVDDMSLIESVIEPSRAESRDRSCTDLPTVSAPTCHGMFAFSFAFYMMLSTAAMAKINKLFVNGFYPSTVGSPSAVRRT